MVSGLAVTGRRTSFDTTRYRMSLLIVPLLYPDFGGVTEFLNPFQHNFRVADQSGSHRALRPRSERWESDPRKIADVILQLANSDEVPVRLILGVDAEKRVQQAEAARAAEADTWRHLTVSTVFEDGRFDSPLHIAKSGINS